MLSGKITPVLVDQRSVCKYLVGVGGWETRGRFREPGEVWQGGRQWLPQDEEEWGGLFCSCPVLRGHLAVQGDSQAG